MKRTRSGTPAQQPGDVERLLDFLRERDAACPLCGYNLRNLTRPQCPECRQPLFLAVGIDAPRFGWLLVTLAPTMFSGIAATLLTGGLVVSLLLQAGGAPPEIVMALTFGWLSGIAGLVLVRCRLAFIRRPPRTQALAAAVTWSIHVAVFLLMLLL